MNRMLFASALATALVAVPLVALAGPKDADPAARGNARRGHEDRGFGHRRRSGARVLRALELTGAQRALLADGRAQAEGVRTDLHAQIEALVRTPLTGETGPELRKARRAKVRELVEAARSQVEPSARRFVAALTPEQKAKLAELATRHGRTFDEAKFSKRIAGMFIGPRMHRQRGAR